MRHGTSPIDAPIWLTKACRKARRRNGEELHRAADALVRGQLPGHGSTALIDTLTTPAPRQAWDAPNWTPTHRPVRLDELVPAAAMSARDARPLDVDVAMRLPPDLFP